MSKEIVVGTIIGIAAICGLAALYDGESSGGGYSGGYSGGY
jgi:hypothetical protein